MDYENYSTVELRWDQTPPDGTVSSSQEVSKAKTFTVTWPGGDDSWSGISDHFDVKVRIDGGSWQSWKTNVAV